MLVEPYIPSTCRTEATPDGRYVRVIYEHHDRNNIELLIPTSQFPSFVKTLQIQVDQLTPKKSARPLFLPGQSLIVDGFELESIVQGELVLKVSARVVDAEGERGMVIPIPVSPTAAERLKESLEMRLANDLPE